MVAAVRSAAAAPNFPPVLLFSVAPIEGEGFIYVILASEEYDSAAHMVLGSTILRREPARKSQHKAHLFATFVRPEHRRQGLGTAIVRGEHQLGDRRGQAASSQGRAS